jgi:hypothetical protein
MEAEVTYYCAAKNEVERGAVLKVLTQDEPPVYCFEKNAVERAQGSDKNVIFSHARNIPRSRLKETLNRLGVCPLGDPASGSSGKIHVYRHTCLREEYITLTNLANRSHVIVFPPETPTAILRQAYGLLDGYVVRLTREDLRTLYTIRGKDCRIIDVEKALAKTQTLSAYFNGCRIPIASILCYASTLTVMHPDDYHVAKIVSEKKYIFPENAKAACVLLFHRARRITQPEYTTVLKLLLEKVYPNAEPSLLSIKGELAADIVRLLAKLDWTKEYAKPLTTAILRYAHDCPYIQLHEVEEALKKAS